MNINILITGGTGLVGSKLISLLEEKSNNIAILSRNKHLEGIKSFYWDYEEGIIDKDAIDFADVIIHLAGENISNKRWTKKQKQKIIDSRVKTTDLLFENINKSAKKPFAIISASAIGYYGAITSEKIFTEDDKVGNDFLAQTVDAWEKSVLRFNDIGVRTVVLRTGVVLAKNGGALLKMIKPIKMGIGSALGNGKQYIPWIEIGDLINAYIYMVENRELSGVYNIVSPSYINNNELMKSLAISMKKPFFFPKVPSFILKTLYGKMSDILLKGSRVSSNKIISDGFKFQFNEIANVFEQYFNTRNN